MARTVLAARPMCRATWRAAALSQACPTASSKSLLQGALLGSCATLSARIPQRGHFTRYVSTTTVVTYSKQGRSRTSRSQTSWILPAGTCCPQREQISFNPAFFRQLQLFAMLVNLHAIDPISRPSKNPRPVVFPHLPSLTKSHFSQKAGLSGSLSDSCAEPILDSAN